MEKKRTINILVIGIILLGAFASIMGIFSSGGPGEHEIISFRNEAVKIYGSGIYKTDSVTAASQGIAQDYITLFLGVPLLIIALIMVHKNSLKGKLLLTGTLGYFLYTFISYVFLWMYNPLFIVYVVLMSGSFFAFLLSITSFDINELKEAFSEKLPVKFLGGFQIFFAIALGMLWLKKIIPTIFDGSTPVGLEHYTTLVIQGLDLGFIVPMALISGLLLWKRNRMGYLMSSVIIVKGFTMGAAVSAMIISQFIAGVHMSPAEIVLFPLFSIFLFMCLVLLLKNCKN